MSLQRQIMDLMADNRERTINDVAVRVLGDRDKIRSELEVLVRVRKLKVDSKAVNGTSIYRIASAHDRN